MCLGKRVGYVGQMCLLYFFCFDHLQGQKKMKIALAVNS